MFDLPIKKWGLAIALLVYQKVLVFHEHLQHRKPRSWHRRQRLSVVPFNSAISACSKSSLTAASRSYWQFIDFIAKIGHFQWSLSGLRDYLQESPMILMGKSMVSAEDFLAASAGWLLSSRKCAFLLLYPQFVETVSKKPMETKKNWLVVWNIFYDFPYIGNVIIPTDEVIFFRGVSQPPTRKHLTFLWFHHELVQGKPLCFYTSSLPKGVPPMAHRFPVLRNGSQLFAVDVEKTGGPAVERPSFQRRRCAVALRSSYLPPNHCAPASFCQSGRGDAKLWFADLVKNCIHHHTFPHTFTFPSGNQTTMGNYLYIGIFNGNFIYNFEDFSL